MWMSQSKIRITESRNKRMRVAEGPKRIRQSEMGKHK